MLNNYLFTSILSVLLALSLGSARAQAPDWQGAHRLLGEEDIGLSLSATATDAQGNVYLAGTFLGHAQLGGTQLVSYNGSEDIFVAKWSAATQRIAWALGAGSPYQDNVLFLKVEAGQVYVAGLFAGEAIGFGALKGANGRLDSFLTKLTDAGTHATVAWTRRLGPAALVSVPKALVVQGKAVYVAGSTFGKVAEAEQPTPPGRVTTHYLTKITDIGAASRVAWNQEWQTTDNYDTYEVAALAVQGPWLYVATNLETPAKGAPGRHQLAITRYTDTGATARRDWTWHDVGTVTGLAAAGPAVYLVGAADATATFGHGRVPPNAHDDVAGDLFIAKLTAQDTTATLSWVQRLRTTGYYDDTKLSQVAVRGHSVFVAGTFGGPRINLGDNELTNAAGPGNRSPDLLVAKLADAGASSRFEWAQSVPGPGPDDVLELVVHQDKVYLTGTLTEGLIKLGGQELDFENDLTGAPFQAWLPLGK